MIRIAIIEDEKKAADTLLEYLKRYGEEKSENFDIALYPNSSRFIMKYKEADIVFMDIELPDGNGMETAKMLRRLDNCVTIIFVTNMAQYAIEGYSVGALDFMVKPVTYYSFSTMLSRALARCRSERGSDWIIHTSGGVTKVDVKDISYVEVCGHKLLYHTDSGDYEEWGKMGALEEKLVPKGFARGNSCYLINLRRVAGINGAEVRLTDGTELQLSRAKKKDFLLTFAEFFEGGR